MQRAVPGVVLAVLMSGAEAGDGAMAQTPAALPAGFQPHAFVFCKIAADGVVSACEVMGEAPAGLGALAVKAMDGVKTTPMQSGGRAVAGTAMIPVCFDLSGPSPAATAGGAACKVPAAVYTAADLIAKPTDEQMLRAYPPRAAEGAFDGRVTLNCMVNSAGAVRGCNVVRESPPDLGFGANALRAAQYYTLRPKMVDGFGQPGTISLVVEFNSKVLYDAGVVVKSVGRR